MSNKKISSIEWLIDTMIKSGLVPKGTHPNNILFAKAKEMHKEEIVEAINAGWDYHENKNEDEAPKYYSQTFDVKI